MGPWLPALITGGFSLVVALVTAVFAYQSQRRATDRLDELEKTKAALERETAEEQAKREYKYSALTRPYSEVRPLLFQLRELSEPSLLRTRRIMLQEIEVVPRHLLSSTQRLFSPLVISQAIQQKLTAVDFSVDDAVRAQYLMARELMLTFHDAPTIARAEPRIDYTSENYRDRGRQHLTWGQLQRLVDFLTVKEGNQSIRPMKLSELEDLGEADDPRLAKVLAPVASMFNKGTPSQAPVLWRLMLVYACFTYILIDLVDRDAARPSTAMPDAIASFNWTGHANDESFAREAKAAWRHVEQRLRELKLI
jgi:hypothetical protein